MDMPMVQNHLEQGDLDGAIQAGSRAILDFEQADTAFVQSWLSEAFTESVMTDVSSGARKNEFHQSPGAALDLSFGKMLGKPGAISARLRALVSAKPSSQADTLDLADIFGWNEQAFVQSQAASDAAGSTPSLSGGTRRSRVSPDVTSGAENMATVHPGAPSAPRAPSVPLGLEPTGTSIDVGRLAHTMLRPGVAPEADFNLVAPVSVAIAQAAHLKPTDEAVGGEEEAPAAAGGGGQSAGRDEIPEEVIEVLAMKIAGQISRQMKFEQDRSGRWDS
jgi:hypothetical protein